LRFDITSPWARHSLSPLSRRCVFTEDSFIFVMHAHNTHTYLHTRSMLGFPGPLVLVVVLPTRSGAPSWAPHSVCPLWQFLPWRPLPAEPHLLLLLLIACHCFGIHNGPMFGAAAFCATMLTPISSLAPLPSPWPIPLAETADWRNAWRSRTQNMAAMSGCSMACRPCRAGA
jgi:hypothetical protein